MSVSALSPLLWSVYVKYWQKRVNREKYIFFSLFLGRLLTVQSTFEVNLDEHVNINNTSKILEVQFGFFKSTFLVPLSLLLLAFIAKPIFLSLFKSYVQEICAFILMPLPATFSILAIFIITLPFSIYYPGQDMTFFWTWRVKLPKCKNCQLWKVLKKQWLLAVLKVKSLFLFQALCAEFYYRHESDGHMSLQRMREGQWPTSQEKTSIKEKSSKEHLTAIIS